jgi:hypothetical protein
MIKRIVKAATYLFNQYYLLIILILVCKCQPLLAQDTSRFAYLEKYHEKINTEAANNFHLFDADFYSNQLFVLSESHGYDKPHQIDALLFQQLNKKNGTRHYLAEIDFSQAWYINKYMATGNEDLLKAIYQYWFDERFQWGCKAGFDKWKKLYAYNKTLPASKKIVVLGLDQAQDLNLNAQLLNELVAEVKYKKGKNLMIDSLAIFVSQDLRKDTSKSFRKFCRRWVADISKNEASYKKLLVKNYFPFQYIINNIANRIGREQQIYNNFNTYYKQYKLANKKMYGFWGRFHAMQDSINGDMSFSAMLKKSDLPLKNKIISIPVFCVESSSMLPTAFLPPMAQQKGTIFSKASMVNDDSFVYTVNGIKTFRQFVVKNEVVLFKLNAANSPYRKGLDMVESNSQFDKTFNWAGNKKTATVDYFQYAFVVSNADWAVPFGDNRSEK